MLVETPSAFTHPELGRYGSRCAGRPATGEARTLIEDELEHRFRNLLAVVDAIVRQTLRSPVARDDLAVVLSQRIAGLAQANDFTRVGTDASSCIGDVVETALGPFGGRSSGQFEVGGPEILVSRELAVALSLVLHELATNALKHGALSTAEGRVSVRWERAGDEVAFAWAESGGPPVRPSGREGLGLWMIGQALAPHVEHAPEFLRCDAGIHLRFRARIAREPAASPGDA